MGLILTTCWHILVLSSEMYIPVPWTPRCLWCLCMYACVCVCVYVCVYSTALFMISVSKKINVYDQHVRIIHSQSKVFPVYSKPTHKSKACGWHPCDHAYRVINNYWEKYWEKCALLSCRCFEILLEQY